MSRRLLISAVAAVVMVAGSLVLQWAPSPGAPGNGGNSPGDGEFAVAGDGSLPEKRPALRDPGAPLSTAERGYAIKLALATLPDSARDVLDAPGAEVLTADLPAPSERAGRRRAQVSAYDYRDNELHQILLDLATGTVVADHTSDGLQLPPSAAEARVALDLALASMPAPAFVDQFREVTGAPLLVADQVDVIAGTTSGCGTERCVQLLVALPSGQYLSTDDFVVNLSRRTVTLRPAGGHRHAAASPAAKPAAPSAPSTSSAPDAAAEGGAEKPDCGSALVTRTLSTGSAWRMCARIHPFKGLVLEDVQFRPGTGEREHPGWMRVIGSLYLAQLNVPYDTGQAVFDDITGVGFGNDQLLTQTPATCAGDTLDVEQSYLRGTQLVERTIPGICLRETETGLGWHSQETWSPANDRYTQQGRGLEVSSLSKVSWYEYQQKVTLSDQGVITVDLGAAGDLAPGEFFFPADPAAGWPLGETDGEASDRHAASHWHNATYRVDFAIDTALGGAGGGAGAQRVEQWDYEGPPPPGLRMEGSGVVRQQAFSAADDVAPTTWWRVVNPASLNRDGHPRSYEIVNDSIQYPTLPVTRPQVSFTNDHPCQEYASGNLNAECPGQSVLDYVAAEIEPLTDPVAWVNVGFHHVPRDEDQSPMPVHWQSFSLVPRDLLAQQALTPAERACDNGYTLGAFGSCAAINLTPPRIVADTAAPGPGSVLTADPGTWRMARAALSYQRLWLRDGAPILTTGEDGLPVAATGDTYRVTDADVGHGITVQVTASAAGITPGSATSAVLEIPVAGPPTSTDAVRAAPDLRLKLLKPAKNGKPRLRIVVRGSLGPGVGTVTLRRAGHPGRTIATGVLRSGRAVVRLPRPGRQRYRVKVTYPGDQHYLPAKAALRVRRQ